LLGCNRERVISHFYAHSHGVQEKTLSVGLTPGHLDDVLGKQAPGLGLHNCCLQPASNATKVPDGWDRSGPISSQPAAPSWSSDLRFWDSQAPHLGLFMVPFKLFCSLLIIGLFVISNSPRSRPVPAQCQRLAQYMDPFPAFLPMWDSFGRNVLPEAVMTLV